MIELQDIFELDKNEIINILLKQEQPFKIYIPKTTVLFSSSNYDISYDYACLAYCGQLLYNLSKKFDYESIQPHEHESVCFTIEVSNIEPLAALLQELCYLYTGEDPNDENYCAAELVANYMDEVEDQEIKDVPCMNFYETAKEFLEQAQALAKQEEEDEDDNNDDFHML